MEGEYLHLEERAKILREMKYLALIPILKKRRRKRVVKKQL